MQFQSYLEIFDTTEFTAEKPVSPLNRLFTYYPSEEPASLHYHNFMEIGYCESGTGVFIVDGDVLPFSGKCVSIIYAGQVHIAKSTSSEKSLWHFLYIDVSKLFIGFDPTLLASLKAINHQNFDFPNLIPFIDDPSLYSVCKQVMYESSSCKEHFLPCLQGLVYSLLIKHGRYMKKIENKPNLIEKKNGLLNELGDVLNFMNTKYMEDVTIDDLVAISNFSKPTLQRKIIALTKYSPMQYIHNLRLNHAAVMLIDKHSSISNVATEVGYNSLSSFNRLFLKKFKMSPSEWKTIHSDASKFPQDIKL